MLHISQEDRLKIIQRRINQYNIRFPVATLNKEIGEDMGNISKMLKGKKTITDNFFTSFLNKYPEKSVSEQHQEANNFILPIGSVNITLADYIELLKTTNEKLFAIINSTLGQIHEDSRYTVAYQKAWVKYEAERVSGGDKQKEAEVNYKLNKLVDDVIESEGGFDSPGGTDNSGMEGQ